MDDETVRFFEGLFRSLETEMNHRFESVHEELVQRFDKVEARLERIESRMDRIGGLVNGGSRAIARLAEWSERQDQFQLDTLRRLNALDDRVARLESDKGQQQ